MNIQKLIKFVNDFWDNRVISGLSEFIRIPCLSTAFDPDWKKNGYLESAAHYLASWARQQNIAGLYAEVVNLSDRSPFLYIEIPGTLGQTVVFYGHMDKVRESVGWNAGLGPWNPVLKEDILYGRGSVDDGYSMFTAISAIKALHEQGASCPRCVILIEACEESESPDFPFYLKHLQERIGYPVLVIALDAECADYDRLWITPSIRGLIIGNLTVKMLTSAVHSGIGGGIIPSVFDILQELLGRIRNEKTGEILIQSTRVDIPEKRREQAKDLAKIVGKDVYEKFPLIEGGMLLNGDVDELVLKNTWHASLAVIGMEGIPSLQEASSVLLPEISLKLALRIPPVSDPQQVIADLRTALENNAPYRAKASFEMKRFSRGWHAPFLNETIRTACETASKNYFGNNVAYRGTGGAIGVVSVMESAFPNAQFIVGGIEGPGSNAHGSNEGLYIPAVKKLTCCLSHILSECCKND